MDDSNASNLNASDLDRFDLHVEWLKNIFLTQDPFIVQQFKEGLDGACDPVYYRSLVVVTLCSLAETHPSVFRWVLYNYDADLRTELEQKITDYAMHQLMRLGFVPGSDFSGLADGRLLVHAAVKAVLLQNETSFFTQLMQEFLYVPSDVQSGQCEVCCG